MTTAQPHLTTIIQLILITSSWAITTQTHAELTKLTNVQPTTVLQNTKSQNNTLFVTASVPPIEPTDNTNNLNPAISPTLLQLQQATIIHNPEVKARYASAATAQSNIDIAKTGWMPAISANANKTYGRSNDSFKDTNVPNRKINETGKIGINISQPLYDPNINLNIDQAKLSAKASDYAITQTYDDLTNRTVALFFDILATQAQINLLAAQQIAVEEQKKQAQKSFEVGTVSITDVREAEAKYDKIAAQKATLAWQLQAKQAELSVLTGGLTLNPKTYKSSTKILPELNQADLNNWQNALTEQNTTVQQAQTEYQIAKLDTKKQKNQYYPKAQLIVDRNYNFEPLTDKGHQSYTNNQWDWSAGIQLSMNLYNSNTNTAQIKKVLAEENLKYQNLQIAKEQQQVELQRTFYQVLGSIAEYQGQYTATQSAKTALSANMLGYQVGMRVNADVLEAQSKVYEANKDRLLAWYDSWKNYIKLNQIAGTLTPDQLIQIDDLLRQEVKDKVDETPTPNKNEKLNKPLIPIPKFNHNNKPGSQKSKSQTKKIPTLKKTNPTTPKKNLTKTRNKKIQGSRP